MRVYVGRGQGSRVMLVPAAPSLVWFPERGRLRETRPHAPSNPPDRPTDWTTEPNLTIATDRSSTFIGRFLWT